MKKALLLLILATLPLTACGERETTKEGKFASGNFTNQGYELMEARQFRPAIAMFDQALANDKNNMRAYQGKGIALNKLGKHGEAENVYEAALKIQPDAVGITNNLAMSKILRGKYQEAIDVLTPLAKSEKENDTVMENLALANCLLGKKEEAKKLYSKRLPPREVEENLRFCKQYDKIRKKD